MTKKKTQGWLDKYDEAQLGGYVYPVNYVPQAENGIEGTMGGLTDVGFNYNGAWGGQWAMGGSLPGASGMMYARTGAPSKGPRRNQTDVTDASAQNGKEMKFYQEGLDFTPKTISRDGSEIPQAQPGKAIPKWQQKLNEETSKLDNPLSTFQLLKKGYSKEDAQVIQNAASKQQPVVQSPIGRQLTNDERLAINEEYAKQSGKKFNPTSGAISNRVSQNTERTMNRAMENIIEPMLDIEMAIGAGQVIGAGAKTAGKYLTEKTTLKNAYKYNPWAFKPNEANWYRQVGKSAIDDAIETGLVREAGEEVSPRMFQEFQDQLVRMQGSGMEAALASRRPKSPFFAKGELFYPMGRKPTMTKIGKVSKNPAGKGDADYLIETTLPDQSFQPAYVKGMNLGVPTEVGSTAILKPDPKLRNLENFKIYEKNWLKGYKEVKPSKSVSEYPVQYVGPNRTIQTIKEMPTWRDAIEAVSRKDNPNFDPDRYVNWIKRKDGGDIPVDPDGYWNPDNWGKPVIIPSTDITMNGVDQPLIGISDTGDTKMMYPGEDYQFEGNKVTEYPMKKNGGWLEKYK